MVAVTLHQRLTLELGRLVVRDLLRKKFAQQEGLLAEAPGVLVVGKKIEQFIAKDCDTTGL